MATLSYALRSLIKRPLLLGVVLITLAVGIGATSTVFTVVRSLLLRGLPFQDPNRLVMIWTEEADPVSLPDFRDWRRQSRSFEDMAFFNIVGRQLTGAGEPEEVGGATVSSNFFSVLGVSPLLGRGFSTQVEPGQGLQEVLLSHGLWRRRFGGDPQVIGRKVVLSRNPYTVMGVMPAGFRQPEPLWNNPTEFWIVQAARPDDERRGNRALRVVARLRPGVSQGAAQTELRTVVRRLGEEHPDADHGQAETVTLVPLRRQMEGDTRPKLLLLMLAAALIFAIVCVNLSNLQLARALARAREVAIREALGAGRWALAQQSVAESVVLAVPGTLLGLTLASWSSAGLAPLVPLQVRNFYNISIDFSIVAFTALAAFACCLLAGLIPLLYLGRLAPARVLGESGRSGGGGTRVRKLHRWLVVLEIGAVLPLLVVTGIAVRAYARLSHVPLGFDPQGVLTFRLSLPRQAYTGTGQIESFFSRSLEELAQTAGVRSVAVTSSLPLSVLNDRVFTLTSEEVSEMPQRSEEAHLRMISPDYFSTLRIPLVRGRSFTNDDRDGSPEVVIVSQALVHRLWPGQDGIGRRLKLGGASSPSSWMAVVGVVGDVRQEGPAGEPVEEVFLPFRQGPEPAMFVAVRADSDPHRLIPAVRRAVARNDANLALADLQTLQDLLAASTEQSRLQALLLAGAAAIALILATVGVFGVVSYSIEQRRQEIGIRMALGATSGSILRLLIVEGLTLGAGGIGLGLVLTYGVLQGLSGRLPLSGGLGPGVGGMAAVILIGLVLTACYVPARRAADLEPAMVLKAS